MKNIKLGDELTVGYDIFDKYGNFVAGGTRVITLSDEVSDEYLKVRIKGEKDTVYCIPPEVFKDESNESVKDDFKDDKLRWDLLPLEEIEEVVRVLHAGAKKYGPNRWQNLPDAYNRYKAAMFRHLIEVEKGNAVDEDTGCLHIAQVVTNALFMLYTKRKEYGGGEIQ